MFKNDENVDNKIFIKNIEIGSEEKSLPFESVHNLINLIYSKLSGIIIRISIVIKTVFKFRG